MLTEKLRERLVLWQENADEIKALADELVEESYGYQLLETIGYVYEKKAKRFIGERQFLGIPGFFSKMDDRIHIAKGGFDVLVAGIDATMKASKMQKEEAGEIQLTAEEKRLLEQETVNKTLNAVWCVTKLDVEYVIRVACENILLDTKVPEPQRIQTAQVLKSLGAYFLAVARRKEQKVIREQKEMLRQQNEERKRAASQAKRNAANAPKPQVQSPPQNHPNPPTSSYKP